METSRLRPLSRLAIFLLAACSGCVVYDRGLLNEAELEANVSATGGGAPTDGVGGTAEEGTGGADGVGGGEGSECVWTQLPPVLSREPFEVIDNFNDGDNQIPEVQGRDGSWFSFNDGTSGLQSPAVGAWGGLVMAPVDENESNRALHYQASGFTGSGKGDGWHGFAVDLVAGDPYPLGGFDGLAFWARADCDSPGSEQATLRLAISDSYSEGSAGAVDHPGSAVNVELIQEWRQIKLPFDNFTRRFGGAQPFDPDDAITLYFSTQAEGPLDVWIDDLVVYSDE